jgi:hypothetical protein
MRALLILAGLLNTAFVAFHVFLGVQITHWTTLPLMTRGLIETLNGGCTLVLAFLGFVFLVRGKEVMGTGLGAATLALGTLIYFSRAVEEFIWLNGNWKIAAICTVVGLMHAVLFTDARVTRKIA